MSRLSRRNFVQLGVLGFAGWTLSDWCRMARARCRNSSADSVLFINLAGGPSHLDTLDMKPDAPAETRGEFKSIQSKITGLRVCEHLSGIANIADQISLIRGISHTTGDHPQGQRYIATGNRPGPALQYPSYGSIIKKELASDPDLPAYIAIPQTEWDAGYMGDAFAPFKTNAVPKPGTPFEVRGISLGEGLTVEKVRRRDALLKRLDTVFNDADTNSQLVDALDTFGRQAFSMITSTRTRLAFDVAREPESIQAMFAKDELSQSMLLAARLVSFGVRFVTVTNQGWDTHLDNFVGHKRLMGPLDVAFPGVLEALKLKGLLERTLVVMMGEFGRTPKINANVGRDHYPRANWCVVAGGGVQPGQLIGATNAAGTAPTPDTDFQPDDIGATILHALGVDHLKEYHTKTGRPVSLIPHGRVLHQLFDGSEKA